MNKEASNAFLKLLEEPPKKTFFILVAESSDQLLATLLSRCQLVPLPPIDENELLDTLEEDIPNREGLVKQAEGDYRKLSLLVGNSQNKAVEALLIKVLRTSLRVRGDNTAIVELMSWAGEISVLGREEQKTFLQYGIRFIRDAFLLNYSLGDLVHFKSENGFDINKLGPFVNSENINELITLFEKSNYHITRNANAKMVFTELSLQLTRLLKKASE
jgi:DNA polymerase-3 subunit delta'